MVLVMAVIMHKVWQCLVVAGTFAQINIDVP